MGTTILAFICGFWAYLLVDIVASRLSGETEFSLPSASLVVGLICASAAHYLGIWVALGCFLLIALIRLQEVDTGS